MVVEDVHAIQAHALQGLIKGVQQVFPGAPHSPVRARPHLPSGLGGNDQFLTVPGEVLTEDTAEVELRGTRRRTIVVGQIEVRDAQVESLAQRGAHGGQRSVVTEVVPQPQGQRGQFQARVPHPPIRHGVVTVLGRGPDCVITESQHGD